MFKNSFLLNHENFVVFYFLFCYNLIVIFYERGELMKKVIVVTDSNSGITQEEGKKLGCFVIPMPFTINDEEYLEDINMTQKHFFELLAQDADVHTSQPSQTYLEELWTDLLKVYNEIVYIPMTSGLSGTCENAKEYAKKFDDKVQVVDNLRISISQKMSVMEALELAKMGKSAKEIKEYLEETKDKCSIYLVVNQLKYLKKGGRVTPTVAALGNLLKLKPILSTRGGAFEKFAITMSMGQAKKKIIQKLKSELENEFKDEYESGKMVLALAHTNIPEEAQKCKEEIRQEIPNIKIVFCDPLSLSVACHTGPGALGIGIFINNFVDIKEV